jgi:signal peptidase II
MMSAVSIDRPREQHEHDTDDSPRGAGTPNPATNGNSGTAAHEGVSAGPDAAVSAESVAGTESCVARPEDAAGSDDAAGVKGVAGPEGVSGAGGAATAERAPAASPEPTGGPDGSAAAAAVPQGMSSGSEPAGARPARTLPTLLLVAVVVFALDLVTKALVVAKLKPGEPISIIGQVVQLTLTRNPGAAFSMATSMTWLLALIAAAVVIGVIRFGRSLRSVGWAVGLGLVLGGTLGNLMDRLFRSPGPLQGHVVDFIAVTRWWPIFNVADSSIVCGVIVIVVLNAFGVERDAGRHRDRASATEVHS